MLLRSFHSHQRILIIQRVIILSKVESIFAMKKYCFESYLKKITKLAIAPSDQSTTICTTIDDFHSTLAEANSASFIFCSSPIWSHPCIPIIILFGSLRLISCRHKKSYEAERGLWASEDGKKRKPTLESFIFYIVHIFHMFFLNNLNFLWCSAILYIFGICPFSRLNR